MVEVLPQAFYNLSFCGAVGVLSSLGCLIFIIKRLEINQIIKKLLLFANVHQLLGYILFLMVVVLQYVFDSKNRFTCFLIFTSMGLIMKTTQGIISMISVIRYVVTWVNYLLYLPHTPSPWCVHFLGQK